MKLLDWVDVNKAWGMEIKPEGLPNHIGKLFTPIFVDNQKRIFGMNEDYKSFYYEGDLSCDNWRFVNSKKRLFLYAYETHKKTWATTDDFYLDDEEFKKDFPSMEFKRLDGTKGTKEMSVEV